MGGFNPYSGTEGDTPEEVARQRKLSLLLAQQGMETGPTGGGPLGGAVGAFTRGLQGFSGAGWGEQARQSERSGQAGIADVLARAATSKDPASIVAGGLQSGNGYALSGLGPMASHLVQSNLEQNSPMGQAKLAHASIMAAPPGVNLVNINPSQGEVGKTIASSPVRPPPSYEPDPANPGAFRPSPGGPADIKFTEKKQQAYSSVLAAQTKMDDLLGNINALMTHPGLGKNFGLQGALPNMPGSPASDAWALLQQLKSQGGFALLQQMRDASKTGGALGSVSDAEGARLESAFGALQRTSSPQAALRELAKIKAMTERSKAMLSAAYQRQYGTATPAETPTRAAPDQPPPDVGYGQAKQAPDGKWYVPDPKRPGKFLRIDPDAASQ